MVLVGVILAVAVLLVIAAVLVFNRLVRYRNLVADGWAGIDVQLTRRADLVPNLVEVVKGYQVHEQKTLDAVVAARSRAQGASGPAEAGKAEEQLQRSVGSLLAVAEAYPDLKANESFLDLQRELSVLEEDLSFARQYYNAVVRKYNTLQQTFPVVLIASPGGHPDRRVLPSRSRQPGGTRCFGLVRLVAAVAVIGASSLLFGAAPAKAQTPFERIDRYAVAIEVTAERRPPCERDHRLLLRLQPATRHLPLHPGAVPLRRTLRPGVPDQRHRGGGVDAGTREIKSHRRQQNKRSASAIPDRTITGRTTTTSSYNVRGAFNRFEGHDELYWNTTARVGCAGSVRSMPPSASRPPSPRSPASPGPSAAPCHARRPRARAPTRRPSTPRS